MEVKGDLIVHGNYIENQTINVQGDLHMGMPDAPLTDESAASQRGRTNKPEERFADYVNPSYDAETLTEKYHKLVKGKKGKALKLIMRCGVELGQLMDTPPFAVLERELGAQGTRQGYDNCKEANFKEEEKKAIKELLSD